LEQNPRDADAHFWYGNTLEKSGNLDAAIEQFRSAVKLPPRSVGRAYLYRDLGEALERKGDLEGALDTLQKCVVSWPVKNEPYCAGNERAALGRVLEKKEGAQAALAYWESMPAVARDPDQCRAQIGRIESKTK
jgi:tetratricopeptide (TPR) repeat protein